MHNRGCACFFRQKNIRTNSLREALRLKDSTNRHIPQTDTDFVRQLHIIENNYLLLRTIYAGALLLILAPCGTKRFNKQTQLTGRQIFCQTIRYYFRYFGFFIDGGHCFGSNLCFLCTMQNILFPIPIGYVDSIMLTFLKCRQ